MISDLGTSSPTRKSGHSRYILHIQAQCLKYEIYVSAGIVIRVSVQESYRNLAAWCHLEMSHLPASPQTTALRKEIRTNCGGMQLCRQI